MAPNWKKFQNKVHEMIDITMGAMDCTIEVDTEISYDFINGEVVTNSTTETIKTALIPINKDDLKDLPEGLREKITKKVYTKLPIPTNAKIKSLFDGMDFQVIAPSVALTAGGMVHCYRTFLGKVENTISTGE